MPIFAVDVYILVFWLIPDHRQTWQDSRALFFLLTPEFISRRGDIRWWIINNDSFISSVCDISVFPWQIDDFERSPLLVITFVTFIVNSELCLLSQIKQFDIQVTCAYSDGIDVICMMSRSVSKWLFEKPNIGSGSKVKFIYYNVGAHYRNSWCYNSTLQSM